MEIFYNLNLFKKMLVDEYPFLRKFVKVNYGLLPDIEDSRAYIMGASNNKLNWKILKPDSNWLPEAERMVNEVQKSGLLETMNCTRFSLNNVKEMIHINKWNETYNYNDRFPGNLQGTTRSGNSMQRQLEVDRTIGCIKEEDWPWDKEKFNWNDYYATPPANLLEKGKKWTKDYVFGYDSVWATRSMVIEALKYSPLYVGLFAWYRRGMLYFSTGNPNHASTIINRKQFMCYDSYNPFIKNLDENFKLYYVKRIYLEKTDQVFDANMVKSLLKRGFLYIQRTDRANGGVGQVYLLTKDGNAIEMSEQLKMEAGIQGLAQRGDLTGISEKDFYNLLK